MEKYCPECRKVFENEDYLLCPYCGTSLKSRVGRQPIPRELRHQVFQRDNYRCRECGATNKETTLEIDHIIPVAEGGTNDIDNLQTLCKECNRAKLTDEWVGGETSLRSLKKELINIKRSNIDLKNKLKFSSSEEEEINYRFKLKINNERKTELKKLIEEKEIEDEKRNKEIERKNNERKERELMYKKLYINYEEGIPILKQYLPKYLFDCEEKEVILDYLLKKYTVQELKIIAKTIDIKLEK